MAIASMWASMTAWFTPSVLFCATNLIIATIFIASNNQTKHPDHDHDHLHQDNNIDNNINIPPTRISRVSSFILNRARSFKLPSYSTTESQYQYPSEEPKTPTYSSTSRLAQSIHQPSNELYTPEPETQPLSQPGHTPSLFQRVKSIKFSSDDNNNINPPGQLTRPPSFLERVRSFRISSGSTHSENLGSDPDPEHHVVRSKSENTTTVKNKKKKKKKLKVEMKKSRSEMKMAASDDDDEDVDARRPATARVRGSNDVEEEVDARADDFISRFKQQLKLQRIESLVRNNQMLN